jgi:hypothetical protein
MSNQAMEGVRALLTTGYVNSLSQHFSCHNKNLVFLMLKKIFLKNIYCNFRIILPITSCLSLSGTATGPIDSVTNLGNIGKKLYRIVEKNTNPTVTIFP